MSRIDSGVMETLVPEDFASLKDNSAALSERSSMSDERGRRPPATLLSYGAACQQRNNVPLSP